MIGVVDYLAPARGFGYIRENGTERTYWFHATALVGLDFAEALQGERVEFDVIETAKGSEAQAVRPVSF